MWDDDNECFKFIDFGLSCILNKGYDAKDKSSSTSYPTPVLNTARETYKNKIYNPDSFSNPCGVIGNALSLSPEMIDQRTGNPDNKNRTYPATWLKAHDVWSLGCVLFIWYWMPDDIHKINDDVVEQLYFGWHFAKDYPGYASMFDEIKDANEKIWEVLMVLFQRAPDVRVDKFEDMATTMFAGGLDIPVTVANWDNANITKAAQVALGEWQVSVFSETTAAKAQFRKSMR